MMVKTPEGGKKKKQKVASKTDEEIEKDNATDNKGQNGDDITPLYLCALCGLACVTKDRVGQSKSKEITAGSTVFHKNCRSKIFGSMWWATLRPKIKK